MPTDRRLGATVIVCAYTVDRLQQTLDCVSSLVEQEPAPAQIVVVADHNQDLEGQLRRRLDDGVAVIPNRYAQGLSGARNTGLENATQPLAVFVDDDAVPRPGWLAALCRPLQQPRVIGSGGPALPVWEEGPPPWFPEEFLWVVGCSYKGQPRRGPVRNVIGANMAFRSEVFDAVGGFDLTVGRLGTRPLGCEETELSIRARRRWPDAQIVMVEDAVVDHHVPRSRGRLGYFFSRCYSEGLSKAVVRRLSDSGALSSERSYATRTLPAAAVRSLWEMFRLRHPGAQAVRLLAIVGGLAVTTVGFVVGRLQLAVRYAAREQPAGPQQAGT